MKNKTLIISGVCIAALVYAPLASAACGPKKASPSPAASPAAKADAATAASPAKATMKSLPFRGTASSVDQTGKTFSIAGKDATRVFMITEKTEITKDGKPATLIDIVDGVKLTGAYWKHDDGKLEARSVKIGTMDDKKAAADTGKKEKAAASSPAASASPAASPKKP